MKIHTTLDEAEVRACLDRAKRNGLVTADVVFDLFGPAGSRSHRTAFEVHLATADRDSSPSGKKRPVAAHAGGTGLKYSASWEEWGEFLAELFAADETAKAGSYKSPDDFHAKTDYAFATWGELPPDEATRAAEQEPEPEYASTAPVSQARLSPDETLARIGDALGTWRNSLHP